MNNIAAMKITIEPSSQSSCEGRAHQSKPFRISQIMKATTAAT
jgi:hypothetical protein